MSLFAAACAVALLSALVVSLLAMMSAGRGSSSSFRYSGLRNSGQRRILPIGAGVNPPPIRATAERRHSGDAASDAEMGRGGGEYDYADVDYDAGGGDAAYASGVGGAGTGDDDVNAFGGYHADHRSDDGVGMPGGAAAAAATGAQAPRARRRRRARAQALAIAPRSATLGTLDASVLARAGPDGEDLAHAIEREIGHAAEHDALAEQAVNDVPRYFMGIVDDDDEPAAGAAPGGAAAPGGGAAAPAARALPPRVDVPDDFVLFGDVPQAVRTAAVDNATAYTIRGWASQFLVAQVAVTELLTLLRGSLGSLLGLTRVTKQLLPKSAATLYRVAARVAAKLHLDTLLESIKIPLPGNANVVARGNQRYVEVIRSPDLAYNCTIPLFDPALCSWPSAPLHYERASHVPAGFFCADTYYRADENAARNDAFVRAEATLDADIAAQIPGIPRSRVAILACGVNWFYDAVNPMRNMSTAVNAFLIRLTNFPMVVARSAYSVIVAGLSTPVAIIRSKRIGKKVTAVNPSPATESDKAMVETAVTMATIVEPMLALFRRGTLIVRAAHICGLPPWFPFQVSGRKGR